MHVSRRRSPYSRHWMGPRNAIVLGAKDAADNRRAINGEALPTCQSVVG